MKEEIWKKLAKKGELKNSIESLILEYDWISFANIHEYLGSYFELKGNTVLEVGGKGSNVFAWINMSEDFCRAMADLVQEKKIAMQGTSIFIYMTDGMMLKLPIAKRERAYKKHHWIPTVFRHTSVLSPQELKKAMRVGKEREKKMKPNKTL